MSLSRAPLTILLVEDDTHLAQFLQVILLDADASLALAHIQRLDTALDRLAQGPFDVILLDLGLEDSAGIDRSRRRSRVCWLGVATTRSPPWMVSRR